MTDYRDAIIRKYRIQFGIGLTELQQIVVCYDWGSEANREPAEKLLNRLFHHDGWRQQIGD